MLNKDRRACDVDNHMLLRAHHLVEKRPAERIQFLPMYGISALRFSPEHNVLIIPSPFVPFVPLRLILPRKTQRIKRGMVLAGETRRNGESQIRSKRATMHKSYRPSSSAQKGWSRSPRVRTSSNMTSMFGSTMPFNG